MATKTFKLEPGWFAKLFGANTSLFSISDEQAYLTLPGQEPCQIDVHSFSNPKVFKKGFFSSSLKLQTDRGDIRLKGLNQEKAEQVFTQLRVQWYSALHGQLAKTKQAIELALSLGYPRTSHWQNIKAQAREVSNKFQQPPEEGLLPESVRTPFVYVHGIANMDEVGLARIRKNYVEQAKQTHQDLFDTVESNPLTENQREACIIDEDNNLVLAGAGTGKTSTLIGRVGFLIKSGQAKPNQILLLAYGKKAAQEMKGRLKSKLQIEGLFASTFHALGQHIITQVEGGKPSISDLAIHDDALAKQINTWFEAHLEQPKYRELALEYFKRYLHPACNPFDFKSEGEYLDFLIDNDIKTLKGEAVKGYGECLIANHLFRLGVEYQYEANYVIKTRSPDFRQYRPDFYLPDYDIYIEHFGIDHEGNTAPWVDREKYQQGMTWKRALHDEHQTQLIETFYYEQIDGDLLERLEQKLTEKGVVFEPIPEESLLETLREFGTLTEFSKLLKNMLVLIKTGWLTPEQLDQKIQSAKHAEEMHAAIELLNPIFEQYQNLLEERCEIDFHDMIGKAIEYVESGRFKPTWTHILVDEFQDISEPRARLARALRDATQNSALFCVGDDWQAIYRFTGSDLTLTTNFQQYFGATQTSVLNKTFRFNDSISDVASRFVTENPIQIKKQIETHTKVNQPAVSLARFDFKKQGQWAAINQILQKISEIGPGSVYLLGRYNYLLPDEETLNQASQRYSQLTIEALTMHTSKGREADFVIMLDMIKAKNGFPCEKVDHPLLSALLPSENDFPFAEERRLFYVAMTRAKRRVYLLTDMNNPSVFVTELIEKKYPIELDEFEVTETQKHMQALNCPRCETGRLVARQGEYGDFWGCSHYPRCDYTDNGCPDCKGVMQKRDEFQVCLDEECGGRAPICPSCGAVMIKRNGRYGEFWGCKNFTGKVPLSCLQVLHIEV